MTTRSVLKNISVIFKIKGYDWCTGEIRHENKLILDNVTITIFGNIAVITYTKPYCEKYLGLVVEWIVNNLKQIDVIRWEQRPR